MFNNSYNQVLTSSGNKKIKLLDFVQVLTILCYVFTMYAKDIFGLSPILQQISLYSFIGFSFATLILNKKVLPINWFVWYGGFIFLSLLSFFYAQSQEHFFWGFNRAITVFLFGASLFVLFQLNNGIEKLKYIYMYIALFIGIYIILTYEPQSAWARLGQDFGRNPNDIGLLFLLPLIFAFRKAYKLKNLVYVIMCILFLYIIFLTGSKKALLGALLFVITYLALQSNLLIKIKNIFLSSFIAIFIFKLIIEIPFLYNIIGYRIENFFGSIGLIQSGLSSSTDERRLDMIIQGFEMFGESPFFGVGLNNYAYYMGVYAHNNYIEILVSLGLFGFLFYYSMHLILGVKLISLHRKLKSEKTAYLLAILVTILLYDTAMVSYYYVNILLLLAIIIEGTKRLTRFSDIK